VPLRSCLALWWLHAAVDRLIVVAFGLSPVSPGLPSNCVCEDTVRAGPWCRRDDCDTAHYRVSYCPCVSAVLCCAVRLQVGRTVLIIAHRLSTVRHADVVMVLDKGAVVAAAPHDQLVATNAIYAHLVRRQLTAMQDALPPD
jgi:hypothetical protein